MNLKNIWIAPALAGLLLVGGCSSGPSRNTTMTESQDRAGYIKSVDKRLNGWEKEANNMDNKNRGRDLMANVRDARAELRNMEGAPSSEWHNYQQRVEVRMRHLEGLEKGTAE